MRIAVYTLTRDRLDYTKRAFESLRQRAGHPFDHYVFDNGSTDETAHWLLLEYAARHRGVYADLNRKNIGIARGANVCLATVLASNYDLIVKFDNDCEVVSDNILSQFVEIYQSMPRFGVRFILSPHVGGIDHQPKRARDTMRARRRIGLTSIVGGLFHVVPADVYRAMGRYPEDLPRGGGCDKHICSWFKREGGEVGYVEGLHVNHMDTTAGQAAKHPEYFDRKRAEWAEDDADRKLRT